MPKCTVDLNTYTLSAYVNMKEYTDFRDYIMEEFDRRKMQNPSYSMRSFARDLEIPPSRLSEVLNGKAAFSTERGIQVAEKLGFTKEQLEKFIYLLESRHARSYARRWQAKKMLQKNNAPQYHTIPHEILERIPGWYFFAVLELVRTPDFEADPQKIAQKLNISFEEASDSMLALHECGFIEKTNTGWKVNTEYASTTFEIPNAKIREVHKGAISRSLTAVDTQGVHDRHLSTIFLNFSRDQMKAAKEAINEFVFQFNNQFSNNGTNPTASEVYQLALQLVRLTDGQQPG